MCLDETPSASGQDESVASRIAAEQRAYWARGERLLLEHWLAQCSEPVVDPTELVKLVTQELVLRKEYGDAPVREEYQSRFPKYATQLAALFESSVRSDNLHFSEIANQFDSWATRPLDAERSEAVPRVPRLRGYEIESELGRGGMGVVYKCRKPPSSEPVVVKLLLAGRHARFDELARFRIEAEALCCLSHESIIKVHDIGVADGYPYFAMEFASGGSISKYLASHPQSLEWIVDAVLKTSVALHHAHTRRILHRDIKPANILIMGDGRPKVSDFGLVKFTAPIHWVSRGSRVAPPGGFTEFDRELERFSAELQYQYRDVIADEESPTRDFVESCVKRTGIGSKNFDLTTIDDFVRRVTPAVHEPNLQHLTQPGGIVGSPQFMSPEQASARHDLIGPATDVYSLGATLYYLVTGNPMFTGSIFEVMAKVRNEWPIPAKQVRPQITDGVDAVIWKCIQKDPQRRYKDCQALAEDLERCLDGRQPLTLLKRKNREDTEAEDKRKYADLWARAFPTKEPKDGHVAQPVRRRWWQVWRFGK